MEKRNEIKHTGPVRCTLIQAAVVGRVLLSSAAVYSAALNNDWTWATEEFLDQ